jgi:hypothetical protein
MVNIKPKKLEITLQDANNLVSAGAMTSSITTFPIRYSKLPPSWLIENQRKMIDNGAWSEDKIKLYVKTLMKYKLRDSAVRLADEYNHVRKNVGYSPIEF